MAAGRGSSASGRGRTARVSGAATAAPEALTVLEGEEPWTEAELDEVRSELVAEEARLAAELDEVEHDLVELMRDSGDGAGDDQADVGATSAERRIELSLANNARDLLIQTRHALERIADGSYGVCEVRGEPIGKARLQAFPRATLCMECKKQQERR